MPKLLFFIKRAHSSATLDWEPLGEIGIAVELPPAAVKSVVAVVLSAVLSDAAPLLI